MPCTSNVRPLEILLRKPLHIVMRCSIASDACTNEPSGEDLCIRQMGGCERKVKLDHKGLDLLGLSDLMGLYDSGRI